MSRRRRFDAQVWGVTCVRDGLDEISTYNLRHKPKLQPACRKPILTEEEIGYRPPMKADS